MRTRTMTSSELVEFIINTQGSSEAIEIYKPFSYKSSSGVEYGTILCKVYFSESNKGNTRILLEVFDDKMGHLRIHYTSLSSVEKKQVESYIREALS